MQQDTKFIYSCIKTIKNTLDWCLSTYTIPPIPVPSTVTNRKTYTPTLQANSSMSENISEKQEVEMDDHHEDACMDEYDEKVDNAKDKEEKEKEEEEEEKRRLRRLHRQQEEARQIRQDARDLILFKMFVGGSAVPFYG
ncbi:hypothetical protein BGW42_000570 [Actinomortierella wolfii]|nr:hypothetical protein BGW42_000570 [Actinomortierella wolfii]